MVFMSEMMKEVWECIALRAIGGRLSGGCTPRNIRGPVSLPELAKAAR